MKRCASIIRVEGYAVPNTEHGSGTFLENITELLPDKRAFFKNGLYLSHLKYNNM
jgi:hypothetical protein